jgi:hypothetical protein
MCVMVFSCVMAYGTCHSALIPCRHSDVMLLQNKDPVLHSLKDYSVCWIVCSKWGRSTAKNASGLIASMFPSAITSSSLSSPSPP